jgi:hypothetical protein
MGKKRFPAILLACFAHNAARRGAELGGMRGGWSRAARYAFVATLLLAASSAIAFFQTAPDPAAAADLAAAPDLETAWVC